MRREIEEVRETSVACHLPFTNGKYIFCPFLYILVRYTNYNYFFYCTYTFKIVEIYKCNGGVGELLKNIFF